MPTSKKPARGRPRTAEKFAGKVARAEKKIAGRLPEIADALLALALGHWAEEVGDDGRRVVYKTGPDRASAQYLFDRIAGKPAEAVEVSGKGGGPVESVVFYLPSNGRDDPAPPGDPAQ